MQVPVLPLLLLFAVLFELCGCLITAPALPGWFTCALRVPLGVTSRGLRLMNLLCEGSSRRAQGFCKPVVMAVESSENDGDKGFLGNLFGGGLFGGGGSQPQDEGKIVNELTREDGWTIRMEIGSESARNAGGTGTLAKGDTMTARIDVRVKLTADAGYYPPQGSIFVSDSQIFMGESGWFTLEENEQNKPSSIGLSLKCPQGIALSGEQVVPPGFIYANVLVKEDSESDIAATSLSKGSSNGVRLENGRVTVKEIVLVRQL